MNQIALPLRWAPGPEGDRFLVTASTAAAARLLDRWGTWPVRTAVLSGPPRSGRSLLARVFAARSGGEVIDDAERAGEEALFHAWNRAQGEARPLLLVAAASPAEWRVALPDLRSRLAASPHAAILPPDDALVRALFELLLLRHGLDARPDLLDWLARRTERSHAAIERTALRLADGVTERQRRLSIPLARAVLGGADPAAGGAEPESR